jgi:hypothetical protein
VGLQLGRRRELANGLSRQGPTAPETRCLALVDEPKQVGAPTPPLDVGGRREPASDLEPAAVGVLVVERRFTPASMVRNAAMRQFMAQFIRRCRENP